MLGELQTETLKRFRPPDEEGRLDRWLDDWLGIAKEVGLERFDRGLKQAWRECKFFPSPGEINERIPSDGAKYRAVYEDDCEFCWGLGWKPVSGAKRSRETMHDRMTRCHCRRIEYFK